MPYENYNATLNSGLGGLFQFAQDTVPFYSGLLFGVILAVLTFSIYFIQESKKGRGDFPVAFAVGCTATTTLAVIMSMISDFMSGITLGIFVALTIVSYIWLFYSEP